MKDALDKFEEMQAKLKRKETPSTVEGIPGMRFSELERRNLAVEIRSEFLGCSVWLCGNQKMVNQLRKDAPEALVFTVQEFRCLIEMDPDPETLAQICAATRTFSGSNLVGCTPSKPKKAEDM
ncbi:MAG: hypothetical protein AB7I96_10540 [Candidatus Dadabacteria bacterium]